MDRCTLMHSETILVSLVPGRVSLCAFPRESKSVSLRVPYAPQDTIAAAPLIYVVYRPGVAIQTHLYACKGLKPITHFIRYNHVTVRVV